MDATTGGNATLVFVVVGPFLALDSAARRFAEAGRPPSEAGAWRLAGEMAALAFAIEMVLLAVVGLPVLWALGRLDAFAAALLERPAGEILFGTALRTGVEAAVFRVVWGWRVRRHLLRRR